MLTQTLNCIHAESAKNLKMFRHFLAALALVLVFCGSTADAKYFDSVANLQKLSGIERELIKTFRGYLDEQEFDFGTYKKFMDIVKLEQSIANKSADDYVGNPIYAFKLINRLVSSWNLLHEYIKDSYSRKGFRNGLEKLNEDLKDFEENEFGGAVTALVRLQRFYNLSEKDFAEGEINGVLTNAKLSWSDCFGIAARLFEQKELPFALKWFENTLEQLNGTKSDSKDATHFRYEIDTLEYLALSHHELGNSEAALEYIDRILELEPDNNMLEWRYYFTKMKSSETSRTTEGISNQNYAQLCRGIQSPQRERRSLKCRLEKREDAFCLLAPLKVEEVYKDPEINIYHGLLTDKQIEGILKDIDLEIIPEAGKNESNIHRLVEQIFQTNLTSSDKMEVQNYGIGGHYEPHYDFKSIPKGNGNDLRSSDRFVTSMFYLSNVEGGGFTVFPKLNIFIRPVKGSMVSWHNLHRSLDPDYRTLHGGCPVAIGSKSVANVWIRSDFLRRPCLLENDRQKSQGFQ